MATSKQEIRRWFERAKAEGATHMLIICDGFDHEDYPVSVKFGTDPRAVAKDYAGQSMQRVMECYAMHLDMEAQLAAFRANHYEMLSRS